MGGGGVGRAQGSAGGIARLPEGGRNRRQKSREMLPTNTRAQFGFCLIPEATQNATVTRVRKRKRNLKSKRTEKVMLEQ